MKIVQKIKNFLKLVNLKKIRRLQDKTMIFSTTQEHLAHLFVAKLKSNNIEAIVLNQKDSMYNAFGNYEIYVKPDDIIKAKYIIDKDNE